MRSAIRRSAWLLILLGGLAPAGPAAGQLVLSANDGKVALVDGTATVVAGAPDTVTVIDTAAFPPRVVAEIEVPTSVAGPPVSVAITPDEGLALVTAAQVRDPADPGRLVPGTAVSVIDLRARPPRVVARVPTGRAPSGVSISRRGDLALVANRGEGTVSVLAIDGATVTPVDTVRVGGEASSPGHVVLSPDGRTALVMRDGDHAIAVLAVEGRRVRPTGRELTAGIAPYGAAVTPDGRWVVVANVGRVSGDADTVSLIDLGAEPPRVVDTITVGPTPEGITLSPDGRLAAVVVMDGSNRAPGSPFHRARGRVLLLRLDGPSLRRVAEAPIGRWSQGAAFTPDGRYLLVQNMVERQIMVLEVAGDGLRDTGHRIAVSGGPAAIRAADRPGR